MTVMMSVILRLLVLIASMASTAWATTWPPSSALEQASPAMASAWVAFSAFCWTLEAICSMLAAVSSRLAACSEVRWERSWPPAETSWLAWATFKEASFT